MSVKITAIPFNPQKTDTFSLEAYELFDDREWCNLLRRRGFDPSKKLTYHKSIFGVLVKQWDIPFQPA